MASVILLIAAILLAIIAALGGGPWEVGSATITLLPLAVACLAAAFLVDAYYERRRP